jgi:hypothetical protein
MSAITRPADAPPAGMDSYRKRIRDALSTFGDDAAQSWEADGHVPREAVAELARRKVFHERWEPGAEKGLPYLLALSQETSRLSGGLALATMGHSEMFTGAAPVEPPQPPPGHVPPASSPRRAQDLPGNIPHRVNPPMASTRLFGRISVQFLLI